MSALNVGNFSCENPPSVDIREVTLEEDLSCGRDLPLFIVRAIEEALRHLFKCT